VAAAYRPHIDLFVLDTRVGQAFGGTGRAFAWKAAPGLGLGRPYLVAGGLGRDNALRAWRTSKAAGVDVGSRVESAPGVKDHEELRGLFASLSRS
jgi:phosphoribosylanthranilate isomerase